MKSPEDYEVEAFRLESIGDWAGADRSRKLARRSGFFRPGFLKREAAGARRILGIIIGVGLYVYIRSYHQG